jgi:hypothetical protein
MESKVYKENYIVYSDGRVWSKTKNCFMKLNYNKNGYVYISLTHNGVREGISIHRLIAQLFIPNPNNKKTVNHKDGNKLNNNVNNLEWMTHSENIKHAFSSNIRKYSQNEGFKNQRGSGNYQSKLTEENIIEIRNSKLKGTELATKFGVTRALISKIINYKLWTHI